ncbi:MAG: hypothetical protein SFV24_16935 [Gemmatimonadales bacterium]|nr:hypothetical protein [Gemmatimonadales bacterium]
MTREALRRALWTFGRRRVSNAQLKYWHSQGLMAGPQRRHEAGRRGSASYYPAWAVVEALAVDCLLDFRLTVDQLPYYLWLLGFKRDEAARAVLVRHLDRTIAEATARLALMNDGGGGDWLTKRRLPAPYVAARRRGGVASLRALVRFDQLLTLGRLRELGPMKADDWSRLATGLTSGHPALDEIARVPDLRRLSPRERLAFQDHHEALVDWLSRMLTPLVAPALKTTLLGLSANTMSRLRDEALALFPWVIGGPPDLLVPPDAFLAYVGLRQPGTVWGDLLQDHLPRLAQEGVIPVPQPPMLHRIVLSLAPPARRPGSP